MSSTVMDPSFGAGASPTIVDTRELTPHQRWTTELDYAEKELKVFHERARRVVRRYIDERDAVDNMNKWFNIFYANTNILKAALYAQIPQADVSRRFKDYNDDTARVASLILQRAINPDPDDPRDGFDSVMRNCVQDRLIPGMAQCWLRLETEVENVEGGLLETGEHNEVAPEPGEAYEGAQMPPNEGFRTGPDPGAPPPANQPLTRITDQRVVIDYVYWSDFLWSPCRVWAERRWVARKAYLERDELVERFGEEKGNAIPLDYRPQQASVTTQAPTPVAEAIKKAVIYEIWDRCDRKVYWLSRAYPDILDVKDDPLQLIGFEPCPEPMLANITTSNTTPRPDYFMIQDQYSELDTVNNRISLLVQACKVIGVYDRASEGVQRMLQEGFDNTLIPVDNWAMFAEKGGIKGQVDWLPLETVINALARLYEAREAIKGQIYELTGIADIVRGASKASETLGAQQIKAQFASVRIKTLQDEVARFARDILRIKAEIMVKHFDPILLVKKSNVLFTENNEHIAGAVQLFQSEEGFEWRIAVQADSMAQADYAMEKKDRIEFMGAVSSYLEKAGAMFQVVPESAPLLVTMLKWAIASFKNASEIEGVIDKALDALNKNPPQKQDKPDPAMVKAQADAQAKQQQAQLDQAKAQQEIATKAQDAQFEQQRQQMDLMFERQRQQMDLMFEQQRMAMEAEAQRRDLAFQTEMAAIKIRVAEETAAAKKESQSQPNPQPQGNSQ